MNSYFKNRSNKNCNSTINVALDLHEEPVKIEMEAYGS